MKENKFIIGAYCLAEYARSERHVKEIADCGIDVMLSVPNDRDMLDGFQKYGVGAVVGGVVPGWFGGMGENAGTMAQKNPLESYSAEKFEDHPAIRGIDIGDEPSSEDFPHYGKVFERVKALFPEKFPYLNLYPGYAMVPWNSPEQVVEQLGTQDYAGYIEKFCENVPSDYICFDFYPYAANIPMFWENLKIVSDACSRTGREMWIVLQVNSHVPETWTSLNRLRLQAYSALAFGARRIHWACYTAGWWHNQVLDEKGDKTQQYDKLKQMNDELKFIGEKILSYRCAETHFVENDAINIGPFQNLRAENGERLIVGEMVNENETALMICAASDPMDENPGIVKVTFVANTPITIRTGIKENTLSPNATGKIHLQIPTCHGALIQKASI